MLFVNSFPSTISYPFFPPVNSSNRYKVSPVNLVRADTFEPTYLSKASLKLNLPNKTSIKACLMLSESLLVSSWLTLASIWLLSILFIALSIALVTSCPIFLELVSSLADITVARVSSGVNPTPVIVEIALITS